MKYIHFYLLTYVLGFILSYPNLCIAGWERTAVTLPNYESSELFSGELHDGSIVWSGGRGWHFQGPTYHEYAFTWSNAYIDAWSWETYQVVININIKNIIFDETYIWNGGDPPTDFSWEWALTAYFEVASYASNRLSLTDTAQGTSKIKGRVVVPNDSSSTEQEAFARSQEGYSGIRIQILGITFLPTVGVSAADHDILGTALASGETSGEGPYHRKGIVEQISAKSDINGDNEYASAWTEVWFGLPN